ncbi:hypothetical protein [Jidongwangia harbinensis]|uniref:hypothetical protein n=1 Tax=Jidongwangia harbinensis TaxID=2878561 RepID=UPI001CD970F3|nr:hypothetical protein [Jidongwangia harbinensis]MCA2217433.1 hypothetical protein [Jidongwangia harbinensis]
MTWILASAVGGIGIVMLLLSGLLNRRTRSAGDGRPVDEEALRAEVLAAIDRDDLTTAVKIYRQRTGARLLEASTAIEGIDRDRR